MKKENVKLVQGEIVEEPKALTPTGRTPTSPEPQRFPARRREHKLTPEQEETARRLMQHIDTTELEERLLNTYAGGFIGLGYEGDDEENQ